MGRTEYAVFDLLKEPIIALNPAGRCCYANTAAHQEFGPVLPERVTAPLLETPLFQGADCVGTLEFIGRHYTVSVVPLGKDRVMTILSGERPTQEPTLLAGAARLLNEQLAAQNAGLELLDRNLSRLENNANLMSFIAYQRHIHYSLRRVATSLSILSAGDQLASHFQFTPFDLAEVIQETVNITTLVTGQRLAPIRCEAEPEKRPFRGDPVLIERMLLHMLVNALKATPPTGEITVTLKRGHGIHYLTVSDTGSGIPPAKMRELFIAGMRPDPAARPNEGMGLGFPLIRRIAALHAGAVAVETSPTGTKVVVSLISGPDPKGITFESPCFSKPWLDQTIVLTELSSVLEHESYSHIPRGYY